MVKKTENRKEGIERLTFDRLLILCFLISFGICSQSYSQHCIQTFFVWVYALYNVHVLSGIYNADNRPYLRFHVLECYELFIRSSIANLCPFYIFINKLKLSAVCCFGCAHLHCFSVNEMPTLQDVCRWIDKQFCLIMLLLLRLVCGFGSHHCCVVLELYMWCIC